MSVTVVLAGMPMFVKLTDIAHNLDKLFDTDEIGTFHVRDLRVDEYRMYKWQLALDFKSGFDAITAQQLLDGYSYALPNGKEFKINAKVTNDPDLLRKEAVSSPQRTRSSSGGYDEDWSALSSLLKGSDGELNRASSRMDAQLKVLDKQKLILRSKRELLLERKRLLREYRKMDDTDSDDERHRRSRRKYASSPSCHRSSPRDNERSLSSEVRSLRSRSKMRSRSKEKRPSKYLSIRHKYSPETIQSYPWETRAEAGTSIDRDSYEKRRSRDKYDDELYSNSYYGRHDPHCEGPSTSRHEYTPNNAIPSKTHDYHKAKYDKYAGYDNDYNLQINLDDAVLDIMAEMESVLETITMINNINLSNRAANIILKQVKETVMKRMKDLKVKGDTSVDKMITHYRYMYTKKDDKTLMQKLVNELSILEPQNCVDNAQSRVDRSQSRQSQSRDSTENIYAFDDDQDIGDNKIWREVDEVLNDIKMESQSSDDEQNSKAFVKQQFDKTKSSITEIVDVTNDTLIDKENNKQVEIIIVFKKKKGHTQNNELKAIESNPLTAKTEDTDLNDWATDEPVVKLIPPHPKFVITVKNVLRQMKCYINEHVKEVDIDKFYLIIKEEIRSQIRKLLEGKGYMSSNHITKLFREHFSKDNDEAFVKNIVDGMKNGKYDDFVYDDVPQNTEQPSNNINTKNNAATNEQSVKVILENGYITVKQEKDVQDENASTKTNLNDKNGMAYVSSVVKTEVVPDCAAVKLETSEDVTPKVNSQRVETEIEDDARKNNVVRNEVDKSLPDTIVTKDNTSLDTEVVMIEHDDDVITISDSEDERDSRVMLQNLPNAQTASGQTIKQAAIERKEPSSKEQPLTELQCAGDTDVGQSQNNCKAIDFGGNTDIPKSASLFKSIFISTKNNNVKHEGNETQSAKQTEVDIEARFHVKIEATDDESTLELPAIYEDFPHKQIKNEIVNNFQIVNIQSEKNSINASYRNEKTEDVASRNDTEVKENNCMNVNLIDTDQRVADMQNDIVEKVSLGKEIQVKSVECNDVTTETNEDVEESIQSIEQYMALNFVK